MYSTRLPIPLLPMESAHFQILGIILTILLSLTRCSRTSPPCATSRAVSGLNTEEFRHRHFRKFQIHTKQARMIMRGFGHGNCFSFLPHLLLFPTGREEVMALGFSDLAFNCSMLVDGVGFCIKPMLQFGNPDKLPPNCLQIRSVLPVWPAQID